MLRLSVQLYTAIILINVNICTLLLSNEASCRQHDQKKEVFAMSVVWFPVIAFGLAVVVGRIGTVMFREQEQELK